MRLGNEGKQAPVILIVDASGAPVSGATVIGRWDGLYPTGDVSAVTSGGTASFTIGPVQAARGATFIFNVTDVGKGDWIYDPVANTETSDSITVK